MKFDAIGIFLLIIAFVMIGVGLAVSWRLIIELIGLSVAFAGFLLLFVAVSRH